ncbi:phosphatidylinositol N-acetylglucosaminyltransferase [Marasmius fiardii PR-910]|nr:phosphatidylinositol N-acetylglucosaminyltransferase [Marasmius fiardii PR-910]
MEKSSSTERWQKALWRSQPFPDNHIPKGAFLSSLKKNLNFTPYNFQSLVFLSCAITQQLDVTFLFLNVFIRLKDRSLDARVLILYTLALFITGYASWELLQYYPQFPNRNNEDRIKNLKSSILISLALMSLSPVLRTLTAATSSDSIWALSAFLFSLNLLLANYGTSKSTVQAQESLTSVLSINAAISASVVLASRLSNDLAVFSLILFSVQTFVLFPFLRRRIQVASPRIQVFLTLILSALAFYVSWSLSSTFAFILAFVLASVTFLAPMTLVWAQRYKNEIRGPWDAAVPKVN